MELKGSTSLILPKLNVHVLSVDELLAECPVIIKDQSLSLPAFDLMISRRDISNFIPMMWSGYVTDATD